jgi:phenylalanyl-tRNA synthetase beta chain
MICAEDELGLGDSHDGIMVLDNDAVTGTPAANIFRVENDTVFEIGLTPNRIDAASHYGVARDLAAWIGQTAEVKLTQPGTENFKPDNNDYPVEIIELRILKVV